MARDRPEGARRREGVRLERQFGVVVDSTGAEPTRLARWLVAWCALASTWFTIDDDPGHAESSAAIGELALQLN